MFTAIFIAAATGVEPHRQGVASAIASTASGVGAAVGLALLVLLVDPGTEPVGAEALRIATAHGIQVAVYAIAATIAITFVFVLAAYPRSHTTTAKPAAAPWAPCPPADPAPA